MKRNSRTTLTHLQIPIVDLVIDYGDGVAIGVVIEWRKGITSLDTLRRASEKAHGITFRSTGSGANTFVTEIGGQANDMNGQVGQNWMFFVNGQLADVGCGQYELKPNDIVRWEYRVYDKPEK
jgi:hypothetical protein